MNPPLVKVVLHGALGVAVGRSEWALAVQSPAEALEAIETNTNKVLNHLMENWAQEYHIVINGVDVKSPEEVALIRRKDIRRIDFIPEFAGSGGSSGWMALVGALLIVFVIAAPYLGVGVGLTTGAAGGGVVGATGAFVGTMLFGIGASLLLSGFAAMLAPTPSTDDNERPENAPSYVFRGAVNTYRQGGALPVCFGMTLTGSQVISAGIRSINIPIEEE